jgi:release factor glutamine methyltransferase
MPSSTTPRLDAEVLVMHVCCISRGELITRSRATLTSEQQRQLHELADRRALGEPIAYLTGTREFWSMNLKVSPATLIPRPETELLVEKALARIPPDATWTIADLGTGSGAVALALAKERPRCRVIATDISSAALDVARVNAAKFNLTNIEFREGDWFAPLAGETYHIIASNPPYIRNDDPHLKQGDLRFEPGSALISGADGLDAIRRIVNDAHVYLKAGGWFLLEHGWDQSDAVKALLHQQGCHNICCYHDMAGIGRVSEAEK